MDMEMPDLVMSVETIDEVPIEIQIVDIEMELEMEMDLPISKNEIEDTPIIVAEVEEPESIEVETTEEPEEISETEVSEPEEIVEETIEEPTQAEEETKPEPSAKQKAGNKIVEKMGDKGKYEAGNQLKTLVVMQVLGNTKGFFEENILLKDVEGFFTDTYLVDAQIEDNNMASYLLFGGSDYKHNEFINSQYER